MVRYKDKPTTPRPPVYSQKPKGGKYMYIKGETLREDLANLAHEQWSGWMEYLFSKSVKNEDGTVTIPKWAVDRWKRQINTPYAELSKEEQDSDRNEANKFLEVVRFHKEKNL